MLPTGPCPKGSFPCDKDTKCVLQREICDKRPDCNDGQDEDPTECGITLEQSRSFSLFLKCLTIPYTTLRQVSWQLSVHRK